MKKSIGAEVRAYRESRNMSLTDAAAALGVSLPYLCDFEHGRRGLTIKLARGLEKLYGPRFAAKKLVARDARDKLAEELAEV